MRDWRNGRRTALRMQYPTDMRVRVSHLAPLYNYLENYLTMIFQSLDSPSRFDKVPLTLMYIV